MDTGNIAGRRYHAALSPAHDDRFVVKLRIIPLLYAGIKGITVNVSDGQLRELRMLNNARRLAGWAG